MEKCSRQKDSKCKGSGVRECLVCLGMKEAARAVGVEMRPEEQGLVVVERRWKPL